MVTDNRGTTTLAYQAGNDRVASVTDPVTGAVSYTHGLAGERLTLSLVSTSPHLCFSTPYPALWTPLLHAASR